MLEHISPQVMLFMVLYGGAAATALILCLYLLLSKVNVIAPGITPPVPLRRWAAAFFGVAAAGHGYWFLAYAYFSEEEHYRLLALLPVLDCVLLLPTFFGIMLSMLKDRRRPMWPFAAATVPIVILGALQTGWPEVDFVYLIILYTLSLYALFTVYMMGAVRQYRRWLHDHYADLEHKEVRASHTLLIVVLLLLINYELTNDTPSFLLVRLTNFVLFGLLLWRVETLPQLEEASQHEEDSLPEADMLPEAVQEAVGGQQNKAVDEVSFRKKSRAASLSHIGQLLAKHCEFNQLYLQHDLTLSQLSAAIGINRLYLSQYFSTQGMNYNTYINGLRIRHFIRLYQDTVAAKRPFTAQQLAYECGYRSYSTFSAAFKQRTGRSVTSWIREMTQDAAE